MTKTKAKVCGETKGITLKGKPTPGQLLTSYFIEWIALISSSGVADDPLFVVADDHINPEKIDDHMVPGLSLSTHVGGSGTVLFVVPGAATRNSSLVVCREIESVCHEKKSSSTMLLRRPAD